MTLPNVIFLLFLLPQAVLATSVSANAGQPTGDGISLTVGITPGGDGTTCGTATSVEVVTNDVVDLCYTVTNNSGINLAYSTANVGDDSLIDAGSLEPNYFHNAPTLIATGGSYVFHRTFRAKAGHNSYTTTWSAQDTLPTYTHDAAAMPHFVDISTTGVQLPESGTPHIQLTLPFRFPFFGDETSSLWVSQYGYLLVGRNWCSGDPQTAIAYADGCADQNGEQENAGGQWSGSHDAFTHLNAPAILPFNTFFWVDTDNPVGHIYYEVVGTSPNRYAVVQWNRAGVISYLIGDNGPSDLLANVEAILGEDGSISFQYQNTYFGADQYPNQPTAIDYGGAASIGLKGWWYPHKWQQPANANIPLIYSESVPLPHADPSAIVWQLAHSNVFTAAPVTVEVDAGAPVAVVQPVIMRVPSGSATPVSADVAIANAGNRQLVWSLYTAPPTPPAGEGECGPSVPGAIIHDQDISGTVQWSGNLAVAERFTPTTYPATYATVCVQLHGDTTAPIHYQVVVYDDDGPDGKPGTVLGSVDATGLRSDDDAPGYYRNRVDISSLNLTITSGSVYIGTANANPLVETVLFETPLPLTPYAAEGNFWGIGDDGSSHGFTGEFNGISADPNSYANTNKIRAVEAPAGAPECGSQSSALWLSVSGPTSGSIPVGATGSTQLDLNPLGLVDGTYTAPACIRGNYGGDAAVPVTLIVGDQPYAYNDSYATPEGGSLTVPAPGVLANDFNPTGSLTAVVVGAPTHGTLSLSPDGGFTYAPQAGFTGADSFTYVAVNSAGASNSGTVAVAVGGAADTVFADGFDGS